MRNGSEMMSYSLSRRKTSFLYVSMNLADHVSSLGCSNCSRPTSLFSWWSTEAEMQHHMSCDIYDPATHGVSLPSQLWCVNDDGNLGEYPAWRSSFG